MPGCCLTKSALLLADLCTLLYLTLNPASPRGQRRGAGRSLSHPPVTVRQSGSAAVPSVHRPSEVAVSCDDDRDNNDDAKRERSRLLSGVRLRQDQGMRQIFVEKVARRRHGRSDGHFGTHYERLQNMIFIHLTMRSNHFSCLLWF